MAEESASKDVKNNAPTPVTQNKKKKSKLPRWKKIVIGIVVFIVAIIIIAYVATSGAAKVSNEFLSDIQNKRADQAYSLFSKEAKDATDQTTFNTMVDRVGPIINTKAKMTGREVQDSSGSPATAQVKYEIKGTDGVEYRITIQLV